MEPKDLLPYADKAALGFVGLLFLLFLGSVFVSTNPAVEAKAEINENLETIKGKKKRAEKAITDPEPLTVAEAVEGRFSGFGDVTDFPTWVLHARPFLWKKAKDGGPVPEPKHASPESFGATPKRGRIVLEWEASAENKFVRILGYELMRRIGNGDFEMIADLGPAMDTYEDTDVDPKKTYYYQLRSLAKIETEDPAVQDYDLDLEEEDKTKETAVLGPYRVPRNVLLEPIQVYVPTLKEKVKGKKAWAQLQVWKWNGEKGKFERRIYQLDLGDKIGKGRFETEYVLEDVERVEAKGKFGMVNAHQIVVKDAEGKIEKINSVELTPELKELKEK